MKDYLLNIVRLTEEKKVFFLLHLTFLLVSIPLLLNYGPYAIAAGINSAHNPFFDVSFYVLTHLGDGRFIALLLIPLAFIRIRLAVNALFVFGLSGLIVQAIKFLIQVPRPGIQFVENLGLHLVEGTKLYESYSFPSGHTATAFSICLLFSVMSRNKSVQALLFFIALLIGISRIYLLQHFYLDVYVGSIIGIVPVITFHPFLFNRNPNVLDQPLISFFSKKNQ